MTKISDIDVDVSNRVEALKQIDHIPATIKVQNGRITEYKPHPVGVYLFRVPTHPITGIAIPDAKMAEQLGFVKLDVISNKTLDKYVLSIEEFMDKVDDFDFGIFYDRKIYDMGLVHLGKYFELVTSMKPTSIDDIAIILALIRPAKKHLIGKRRNIINEEIWKKSEGYQFKKSHAYGYALLTMYDALVKQRIVYSE